MSLLQKEYEDLPDAFDGFGHVNRYWDKVNNMFAAKILPGEFYVSCNKELIATVLGSCVSACIRDRVFGIGGMNHFMLPSSSREEEISASARYGNNAMELLINEILKHGGHRKNLELKLFGGGRMFKGMNDIGKKNIDFIKAYIATESLNLLAEDLGDIYPRKVNYFPLTGEVKVKKLRSLHNDTIFEREQSYKEVINNDPQSGEVELFE